MHGLPPLHHRLQAVLPVDGLGHEADLEVDVGGVAGFALRVEPYFFLRVETVVVFALGRRVGAVVDE